MPLRFATWLLAPAILALPLHARASEREIGIKISEAADRIFAKRTVTYVWGGTTLGTQAQCDACTQCLEASGVPAGQEVEACTVCRSCGLDCSHFTYLAYRSAGLPARYLTTKDMLRLSRQRLASHYWLRDMGRDLSRALPGDLLVYTGHVVILQRKLPSGRGNVIHVTRGKEVRGPGQGLQKATHVSLVNFRGPLRKILRHLPSGKPGLRPVAKRKRGP